VRQEGAGPITVHDGAVGPRELAPSRT
jgi:hypothetical protein